jgi:DNA-binding transcriptional LysR family regulator
MRDQALFDKIDLHLIRVLHTVLSERSVSRAAVRLGMYQPAVSASLKKLRELAGDPLLVRSGAGMVPTDAGLRMIEPSASILRAAEMLFSDTRTFEPQAAVTTFRVAAADYLDPLFLPELVAQIKAQAPLCQIEIHPLSAESDYQVRLAQGDIDVVIGNWLQHPGARGVIDDQLEALGLRRNITARCPHFGLLPRMVASSLLVLTTGRQFCERYTAQLPVQVLECPVQLPPLVYYQLWHERTQASASGRWLRERVKAVAAGLKQQ